MVGMIKKKERETSTVPFMLSLLGSSKLCCIMAATLYLYTFGILILFTLFISGLNQRYTENHHGKFFFFFKVQMPGPYPRSIKSELTGITARYLHGIKQ